MRSTLWIISFLSLLLSCTGNANTEKVHESDINIQDSHTSTQKDNFYQDRAKFVKGYFNTDTTTATWFEIVSTDGNFKIKFPFQPKKDTEINITDDIKTEVISFDLDIRHSSFRDNNLGYAISYRDAKQALSGQTFEEYIKNSTEAFLEEINGELHWQTESQFKKGVKCHELLYIIKEPEKVQCHQMIINYKNRIYNLVVITDYDHLLNYEISNFFNSLEFLN